MSSCSRDANRHGLRPPNNGGPVRPSWGRDRKDLQSNFCRRRARHATQVRHASCCSGHFRRQVKQMRGQVKQWWSKLTDDDLDRIDGAMEKLAGALQERYGWERDQAEREIKKRFERYDEELRDPARR